jgi:hypothetical protein
MATEGLALGPKAGERSMRIAVLVGMWMAWIATVTVYGLAISASAMCGIPIQPLDTFVIPSLRAYRESGPLVRQIERYLSADIRS